MKKIIYILIILLALTIISCEKDIETATTNPNTEMITFTLSVEAVESRIVPTPSLDRAVNRYIMEVWNEDGSAVVNCFGAEFDTHRSTNGEGVFTASLDKSKSYTILFWADDNTEETYDASSLKVVRLNTGKSVISSSYFARHTGKLGLDPYILMQAAVAEVHLFENGGDFPTFDVRVAYSGYTAFDLSTGEVGEETHLSHLIPKSGYGQASVGNKTNQLGSFRAFATDSGSRIDMTLTESGTDRVKELDNVQLKANKITKLNEHYFATSHILKAIIMRTIGGVDKIHFTASSAWDVSIVGGTSSWCSIESISDKSTSGVASFTINAQTQASSAERTEIITITAGGTTQYITVTQLECKLLTYENSQFIVNDRNLGDSVPQTGEALNFTNTYKTENIAFKGDYYNWEEAEEACAAIGNAWFLPRNYELNAVRTALTKDAAAGLEKQIWYLESENGGKSYFPLSGFRALSGFGEDSGFGNYWSSTEDERDFTASCIDLGPCGSNGEILFSMDARLSVRCIKTVLQ